MSVITHLRASISDRSGSTAINFMSSNSQTPSPTPSPYHASPEQGYTLQAILAAFGVVLVVLFITALLYYAYRVNKANQEELAKAIPSLPGGIPIPATPKAAKPCFILYSAQESKRKVSNTSRGNRAESTETFKQPLLEHEGSSDSNAIATGETGSPISLQPVEVEKWSLPSHFG